MLDVSECYGVEESYSKDNNVDPTKYIVLDVETNGLSAIRDDLLSISIYRPDTGEFYNRFLPLELNKKVVTTKINGIKTSDLKWKKPILQEEADELIEKFDLKNRIILTYGGIDEKFIVKYFLRHKLSGVEYLQFHNFKKEIISSKYSEGNITKDNLCELYGIDNVQSIHTGKNDCLLEWQLYRKMNGNRLLVTNSKVFEFNDEYLVPASYITTFPNMRYYLGNLPKIRCEAKEVFSLKLTKKKLEKFPTNFNGMILEHLINSMIRIEKINSNHELIENKSKLKYLGKLPSYIDFMPLVFNPDGTMAATREQDKETVREINNTIELLKKNLTPLINFVRDNIFRGGAVKSQELVVDRDSKVLAVCDLSSETATLEIKATSYCDVQAYAEQLYFEANGRKCFILQTDWRDFPQKVNYIISEVSFSFEKYIDPKLARLERAREKIEYDDVTLLSYIDISSPVKLRCTKCGNEWTSTYNMAVKHRPCPECYKLLKPKVSSKKRAQPRISEEERQKLQNYKAKLMERSNNTLEALEFNGAKNPAKVRCLVCGRVWESRADHLLERAFCSACKH